MTTILVVGAGLVGNAIARDLAASHQVICADRDERALARLAATTPAADVRQLDVADGKALQGVAAEADAVVLAVPGFLGYAALRTLIEAGKNVVDISFAPEDVLELDGLARERGVVALADIGVAPGLDHMIAGHHDASMEVTRFDCLVGGLPLNPAPPWRYTAPFSPIDVIEEYTRPAHLVENGREVVKPALSDAEMIAFDQVGTLEAFNTDGLRSLIRTMPHTANMRERTLRYPGHRELVLALRDSGFLSETPIEVDGATVVPRDVTSAMLFEQWRLPPGGDDLTVMRVTVEGSADGRPERHVWHLYDVADASTETPSMARTTGYTSTGAVSAVLAGHWDQPGIATGEIIGRNRLVFDHILEHLAARGVTLRHEIVRDAP